jgi:hypothetical protein
MELLVVIVLVFMVTFTIFGMVDMIKQINKIDDTMGTIGSKPKTQTDYQNEHKIPPCVGHEFESQKEIEKNKRDPDFMYKWIREKSGKK